MTLEPAYGLGRIYKPDSRDLNFRMADLLPPYPKKTGRQLWQIGLPVLDQGTSPECVGYGSKGLLMAYPDERPFAEAPSADDLYHEAQALDGDPSVHEGSTVRAALKALQNRGDVVSYHWSTSINDAVLYLLNCSPIILGTSWYERFFKPDKSGLVSIGGSVAGGHCYLAYGVDSSKKRIYCRNSWSNNWGDGGNFSMTFSTLARLLKEQGEAAAALGRQVQPK